MAGKRLKPIEAATAGIFATLIFLLAWSIVERVTDTRPKGAPSGTTFHTANQAGARTTPNEQPSALDNLRTASPRRQN